MADRYWVGGTANWDATAGTKWATTSGGAGGASVPTSADDVYFDAASGAVTCTVSTTQNCRGLNFTGFTGTLAGTGSIQAQGNVIVASGMTWTLSGTLWILGGVTQTLTTNGKSLTCTVNIDNAATVCNLADALTTTAALTVTRGTFTTNNYNVTASSIVSSNSNTRTINLGSSTVSVTNTVGFSTSTNLTFNAGTSQINLSAANAILHGGTGQTFYNVAFTSTAGNTHAINGANTFNNLSVAGRTSAGVPALSISADQTINGTLTLSAGTNATMRTFVRSNTIGTTRTLTCAAVSSLTDIDFRDIAIAGAAAPVSGTRLGDCKGNSGITFDAPKTVYFASATQTSWASGAWNITPSTVGASIVYFPLAQDTAIFPSSPAYPQSGNTVTINAAYNIGTIDMSARTSNTMTLATGTTTPTIYGNWINGTGTTLTGTGTLTFAGRGSQTITSAGKTFTQAISINSPSGSVTLQDALTSSNTTVAPTIAIPNGTFDLNGYNLTQSGNSVQGFAFQTTTLGVLALGSGTFTIAASGSATFNNDLGCAVTGTGTISLTSASAKTFRGGGIQTYPTINQGGTGTLTFTGSNKFAGLTNTAIGRIQFTGGTTNEFSSFTISGALGNLLQLGSTNTTQAILIKPNTWNMGVLSTDAGNNTGLNFLSNDGTMEYLSVSYINGQVSAAPSSNIYFGSTNVTAIYYGSTPVTAIYYGSTQVF